MFFNQPFMNMPPQGCPYRFNRANNSIMLSRQSPQGSHLPAFFNTPESSPVSNFMENAEIKRPFEQDTKIPFTNLGDTESSQLAEGIGSFAQNEKNAVQYYSSLAEKTGIEKNKKILYDISRSAEEEINHAKKISSLLSLNITEPEERNVNTFIPFSKGIILALEEENKAINELSSLLAADSASLSLHITPFIIRKLSRLNYLYLIHTNL